MFKVFYLFGMLCVADPSVPIHQENCFNIWEKPRIFYQSLNECANAGKLLKISIYSKLEEEGLFLTRGELWCIEASPTVKY